MLGAAAVAGILVMLGSRLDLPAAAGVLINTFCFATEGFGLYCIGRHLIVLARTAGVLDVGATEAVD